MSPHTIASNKTEWARFQTWCDGHGKDPLPCTQETLAAFVSSLAEARLTPASIHRAMSAVKAAHRITGQPIPDPTAATSALRRYQREGAPRPTPAPAMTVDDLRSILRACPDGPAGIRDRSLLTLCWAMMARRSELIGLNVEDVHFDPRGVEIAVTSRRAPDDDGVVRVTPGKSADTCPVTLLRAWMHELGDLTGPLFRPVDRHGNIGGSSGFAGRRNNPRLTGQSLVVIIAKASARAGITTPYTAHSLRAGGATAAYQAGADPYSIARHGGWSPTSHALREYFRPTDPWAMNPMEKVPL